MLGKPSLQYLTLCTVNIYKVLKDVNITETIRWNSRCLLVNCTLSQENLFLCPTSFPFRCLDS